jgi:hypothetical protein
LQNRVAACRATRSARAGSTCDRRQPGEETGFQIGYQGVERRVSTRWGGQGVFLPTRYTRLAVGQPATTERHFIEFVFWEPAVVSGRTAWSLIWIVHEVVGADAYAVPGRLDVTTVAGALPPSSYPPDAVGRLQVNAEGEVERVVLGENPETVVVRYRGAR